MNEEETQLIKEMFSDSIDLSDEKTREKLELLKLDRRALYNEIYSCSI